jgi:Ca-activated chloride channel family protein
MRNLIPTLALLSLAGCLSAKQEEALERDSHSTAGQTATSGSQYATETTERDAESWAFEGTSESKSEVQAMEQAMEQEDSEVAYAPSPRRDQARKKAAKRSRLGKSRSARPVAAPASSSYGVGGLASGGRFPPRSTIVLPERSTEEYTDHGVNPFTITNKDAKSTFSIDVDTASYTIARRKIEGGVLPPWESVRVEEFVNYLDYGYASPTGEPFTVHMAAMPDPYRDGHHIMRIGVQAKRFSTENRPTVHLTFLADVSGSMSSPDKLGLAKTAMHTMVDNLREDDTIALCTYAGRVAKILPPTRVSNARRIHQAIDGLSSGGSTAMSSGIDIAYKMAMESFEEGAENRVVILSDGDANVGKTSWDDMLSQIKGYADQGVTLSTIGFGMGNYRDTLMEQLSNKGDGNNFYIDSKKEADRVFSQKIGSSMITIARDVKIQVEFNDEAVTSYRLIGYENRDIADKDFRNDKVDAGEVGSGHSVTALYEVVLADADVESLATVRVRYEKPGADGTAKELSFDFPSSAMASDITTAPRSLRLAYASATFAEVLRQSPHASEVNLSDLAVMVKNAAKTEEDRELARLMFTAKRLGATEKQESWTARRN